MGASERARHPTPLLLRVGCEPCWRFLMEDRDVDGLLPHTAEPVVLFANLADRATDNPPRQGRGPSDSGNGHPSENKPKVTRSIFSRVVRVPLFSFAAGSRLLYVLACLIGRHGDRSPWRAQPSENSLRTGSQSGRRGFQSAITSGRMDASEAGPRLVSKARWVLFGLRRSLFLAASCRAAQGAMQGTKGLQCYRGGRGIISPRHRQAWPAAWSAA